MKKLQVIMLAAALAGATSASASLTVKFVNVSPEKNVTLQVNNTTSGVNNYSGGVQAGIYNLLVDGTPMQSFCIDVDRESGTFSDYQYSDLADAPWTPAGPMGGTHAANIEKLWAAYFSPTMGAQDAAALQLAIWLSLGDGSLGYTVTANSSAILSEANTELANLPNLTAQADLVGLVSPDGQNYVVPVPEATTMFAGILLLLPLGASALRILRKRMA